MDELIFDSIDFDIDVGRQFPYEVKDICSGVLAIMLELLMGSGNKLTLLSFSVSNIHGRARWITALLSTEQDSCYLRSAENSYLLARLLSVCLLLARLLSVCLLSVCLLSVCLPSVCLPQGRPP